MAVGVTCDGERETLGIWWQETEGAKFWLAVLNDLHRRGVQDILICCVDGLGGFPEAIEAVFPQAWVQTCIVHQIRACCATSTTATANASPPRCAPSTSPPTPTTRSPSSTSFEAAWGGQYPMIGHAWRTNWEHIIPFLSLPEALRHAVYTTNSIETLHRQIRKAIKTRGHFPDEQAATKLIYLAIERADGKWRANRAWTAARAALKIHFDDRFPLTITNHQP